MKIFLSSVLVFALVVEFGCAHSSVRPLRHLGEMSTSDDDVRLALSPDGARALWGRVTGTGELEIVESVQSDRDWGAPHPAPFNSPKNDFDPTFSADGRQIFFFSNRAGGYGGDDLYQVSIDPSTGRYGEPVNVGPHVNSAGDEWAPSLSADGASLLFSSDGRGGFGRHDLFVAAMENGEWSPAVNLGPGINSDSEDFDATFLPGDQALIFARGDLSGDGASALTLASWSSGAWMTVAALGPEFNCSTGLNFGPSVSRREPAVLTWSARREGRNGVDLWQSSSAQVLELASAPISRGPR